MELIKTSLIKAKGRPLSPNFLLNDFQTKECMNPITLGLVKGEKKKPFSSSQM